MNIPQMADTLFERAGNASWIVVFKALVTTHHLMVHGNEVRLPALHSGHEPCNVISYCIIKWNSERLLLLSHVFIELTFILYFLQRFIQFLASRNTLFNLSNFLDKTGSHGGRSLTPIINHWSLSLRLNLYDILLFHH